MAGTGTQLQLRGNSRLQDGMQRFLETLSPEIIFSLLKTTTGGLVTTSDVNEARRCLMRYTEPANLLGRRKVKLEYIVQFLHNENVPMKLPADKTTLVSRLLAHWNWHEQVQLQPDSNQSTPAAPHLQSTAQSPPSYNYNTAGHQNSYTNAQAPVPQADASSLSDPRQQVHKELGISFTKWFYTMLNTLNDFDPKHFWYNCSLRVEVISTNPVIQEVINNGTECYELLRKMIENEKIVFMPNLINDLGVTCVINAYGMAQVKVAGTVQVVKPGVSIPGGVFEQVFGLLKDPTADENYKIKFSILRLRAATNELEYSDLSRAIMNTPVVIEELNDSD